MSALLCLLLAVSARAAEPPHPKRLSSYDFDAARSLEQRIRPMPDWLLAAWRESDQAPGYAPYALSAEEKAEFLAAANALPPRLKRALKERLIAFYFISGLKGNGITDWVLDDSGRTYVYMVLNPAGLRKPLSRLLTERESSAFKEDVGLVVDAGAGGSGILYTVAHESAHAFDYVAGITRYVESGHAKAVGRPRDGGWDAWADYRTPLPEHEKAFPARSRLRLYGFSPPELEAGELPAVCAQLLASPFTSLYGATNWADDAAELFLFHHLTRALGRPYRYRCGDKVMDMDTPRRRARAARVLAPLYQP